MLSAPDTQTIDLPTFHSVIDLPYTLTPGRATGTFLAEIGNRKIVGSRFANGKVIAPAEDFAPDDGEDAQSFVEAPHTGILQGYTKADEAVIGLIQLDGCDNEFAHVILADLAALAIGARVEAVWADDVHTSILAIKGFRLAPDATVGKVLPLEAPASPIEVIPYAMKLDYEHAYGPYYGRMFDEIREFGRILGVRTSNGDDALLPPRERDDISHKRTGTWKACEDTGTIRGCSIINLEFVGQTRPPPYVYAEIVLDGASTRLIHMIDVESIQWAKDNVRPGSRVRAIWTTGKRTGSLRDIERFELIDG
jgi:uncharacterized OB-fold protein